MKQDSSGSGAEPRRGRAAGADPGARRAGGAARTRGVERPQADSGGGGRAEPREASEGVDATAEEVKLRVLESLAAGRPVGAWGRRACRSLGLEPREMKGGVVVEREWTEGAYTLVRRLLSRGWSPAAIAVFCRRSPGAVAQLLGRLGGAVERGRDEPGAHSGLPRTGS